MQIVAQAKHDFNGNFDLFSYKAKPSEDLGQAESIAKNQYGDILSKIRSPSTMFMCVWRDTSHTKLDSDRPLEIFLSCSFAPTPVKHSGSLLENAHIFNTIDRANLKAMWKREAGNYHLARFELEILADGQSFRSQNSGADITQIQVIETEMAFPQNISEPFRFNLKSNLPFRKKSGSLQRDPTVSISLFGTAEPIPDWINY